MSRFDELMLDIHKEAEKQAFEEAEKILLAEKNFKALERLQTLNKTTSDPTIHYGITNK